MIFIVAKTINVIVLTLQSAFSIASLVGQIIVTLISAIVSSVLSVVKNFALFFQIIYEDNEFIFTEDLPSLGNNIFDACSRQWDYVQHSISQLYMECYSSICETLASITWSVNAACTVVVEVLFLLKRALVFVGDTLWLILTFIPVQLPLLLQHLLKCMKDIIVGFVVDAYLRLLKITNFLTDVPLESFIGIISAIVIVRLCVHFREDIQAQANWLYWMVSRKLLYIYHVLYNYFTDSEVRAITRLAANQQLHQADLADNVPDEDPGDPAEALCVVCQERQKCVLILPCRHVCLCRECCLRLYGYQRTCPICRTFIYHSVTIYL